MKCKKCSTQKSTDDFYKNDKTCKECRKYAVRENYRKNIDHYKEYEKKRLNLPHRLQARKDYQKTEAGKQSHSKACRKWIDKNPIKRAAHIATWAAIKSGKIHKKPCDVCGCEKANAHHDDYAKPLEVRWLCDKHHKQWHAENGEGLNAN